MTVGELVEKLLEMPQDEAVMLAAAGMDAEEWGWDIIFATEDIRVYVDDDFGMVVVRGDEPPRERYYGDDDEYDEEWDDE